MQTPIQNRKVLVGMSGRMDSAVTAALLKTAGYQVAGLYIQLKLPSGFANRFQTECLQDQDHYSAKQICDQLDIPLYVVEKGEEFAAEVIDPMMHQRLQFYRADPCRLCHQRIRIQTLIQEADSRNYPQIATGHYAQISQESSVSLKKASDLAYDQSHLLFGVSEQILSRMLTPLGGISRAMVRKLAREFGFPEKADKNLKSQCLMNGPSDWDFIESQVASSVRPPGIICTPQGHLLGNHAGLFRYRLGDLVDDPQVIEHYPQERTVVAVDLKMNALVLGPDSDLFQKTYIGIQAKWSKPIKGIQGIRCTARLGSLPDVISCQIIPFEAETIQIELEKPLRAIHSGENIVFYDGDEVLGSAEIRKLPYLRAPKVLTKR